MREVDDGEILRAGQGSPQTVVADDRVVSAVRDRFDERLFAFDAEVAVAHEFRFHHEPRGDGDLRKLVYHVSPSIEVET